MSVEQETEFLGLDPTDLIEHRHCSLTVDVSSASGVIFELGLWCEEHRAYVGGWGGRIDDPGPFFVNVYHTTRHYGGPEEGGWWWTKYDLYQSSQYSTYEEADAAAEQQQALIEADKGPGWRSQSSVMPSWDYDPVVMVEMKKGQSVTKEAPHYE